MRERETAPSVKFVSRKEEVHQGRCPDGHIEVSSQQVKLELVRGFCGTERARIVLASRSTEHDAFAIAFIFFVVEA